MNNVIFYVEDEKTSREAFASYFRRKGYEVHVFDSASAAEEALKLTRPQVIITDQKLSGDSLGWEFLKRSVQLSPSSIRFVLSGYSDADMILHSFKDGVAFDYISKSGTNEEIESKIKSACDLWQSIHQANLQGNPNDLQVQIAHLTKELMQMNTQLENKDRQIVELQEKLKKNNSSA